jgi:methionyl-tRNA synthetase
MKTKKSIWAENVLGYLSMSFELAALRGVSFEELWGGDAKHYYVHGKDNIPFHTIILPALLLASGLSYRLPDEIISSEYMTIEGRKISTSKNYAVWVQDIVGRFDPDSLRYFFISNGPEKRDADFSWREYLNSHNNELLGAYGNLVNRSLAFICRYFGGVVPDGRTDADIEFYIRNLFDSTGDKIEKGSFKDALGGIFEFVRYSKKYFDTRKPWEAREKDVAGCKNTLYNCVQIIANLSLLLQPFLPFSSEKVSEWLDLERDGGRSYTASLQIA